MISQYSKSADTTPAALCCPFCGCTELFSNEWQVGDEHAEKLGADEFGEVWAWECKRCLGSAPFASWNRRPDPWRYPPDLPTPGEYIVLVYRHENGSESIPICTKEPPVRDDQLPMVRWMPVPEVADV